MLVESAEIDGAGDVVVTGTRAAHLRNVLNVARGTGVRIGIIDGPRGTGTVVASTGRGGHAALRVRSQRQGDEDRHASHDESFSAHISRRGGAPQCVMT